MPEIVILPRFLFLSVLMDDCKDCNSKFAHCFRGKCVCKPGYVGDGKTCVPALSGKCSACDGQWALYISLERELESKKWSQDVGNGPLTL